VTQKVLKTKKCLRCNRNKQLHLFSKDKNRKDGLNCYCKSCIKTLRATLITTQKTENFIQYKAKQFRSNWRRRAINNGIDPNTVPTTIEINNWLHTKYPFVCEYTGKVLGNDFGVDHKVSIFRGGTFSLDNLAITSKQINGAKGDLTEEEFRQLLNLISNWEDQGTRLLRRLTWSNSMFQRSK
jgi:5-methylcytosine-specific restriction endonuclease McrA